ncbi:MAG: hypothetical protein ACRDQ1_09110, partial [Sciscionella sp.]
MAHTEPTTGETPATEQHAPAAQAQRHGDGLRAAAAEKLRRLAGQHAELRADQWRAIEALVTERRRILVVQ